MLFGRLRRQALRMLCVRMTANGLEKSAALVGQGWGQLHAAAILCHVGWDPGPPVETYCHTADLYQRTL